MHLGQLYCAGAVRRGCNHIGAPVRPCRRGSWWLDGYDQGRCCQCWLNSRQRRLRRDIRDCRSVQYCVSESIIKVDASVFAGVASSVADGTRDVLGDAALDAARFSAEAKDVAAFKAGL